MIQLDCEPRAGPAPVLASRNRMHENRKVTRAVLKPEDQRARATTLAHFGFVPDPSSRRSIAAGRCGTAEPERPSISQTAPYRRLGCSAGQGGGGAASSTSGSRQRIKTLSRAYRFCDMLGTLYNVVNWIDLSPMVRCTPEMPRKKSRGTPKGILAAKISVRREDRGSARA